MPTVAQLAEAAWRLWPLEGAEGWDAPGVLAGRPTAEVQRVHLAVDATTEVAEEAVAAGADALLVHHPLLLRGVTTVAESTYKGAVLGTLIRGGCALLAAHTNADIVETGTSAVLAGLLRLMDVSPIEPSRADPSRGLGRIGRLPEPTTLGRLARGLADVLPPTAGGIRVAGGFEQRVEVIALCAGAGDSLLGHPAVRGADVYITSDLRHHPASEARETARVAGGPALIDTSHWASEWLWLDTAAAQLRAAVPGIEVTVSDLRTDPWDFAVVH